jgi:hypothetical protein
MVQMIFISAFGRGSDNENAWTRSMPIGMVLFNLGMQASIDSFHPAGKCQMPARPKSSQTGKVPVDFFNGGCWFS